jgi:DNA-binding NarL/FixJ family response regulator
MLLAEMPPSEEQGVERLRGLYGLTRVEAPVALLMACGLGLPEVAARFDIAPSTVSTHAKQIFQKLDVHSQARVTNLLTQLAMIRA